MKILTKVMDLLALSVILSFMILMFSGCQMASGTLSEKEITVFNTEFFNGDITNMNKELWQTNSSNLVMHPKGLTILIVELRKM
jgi:cytochrome b subunit of formate dehydrogenase